MSRPARSSRLSFAPGENSSPWLAPLPTTGISPASTRLRSGFRLLLSLIAMRPLDNAISVGDRRAEAGSSESAALTSFGRALDIRGLFRSRFRRDLGLTVFAQIGLLAIGALTGLLSARLLGPQGRGELAALTLWPLTLISLTHLGTNSAL